MRNCFFVFLGLIVFLSNNFIAQGKTVIEGSIPKGELTNISLREYTDFITFSEKTISSTQADDNFKFTMSLNIQKPTYAILQFGFQKGEIYLEPDKHYNIVIKSDGKYSSTSAYDQEPLIFEIPEDKGLNKQIQSFNKLYNDFVLENFKTIYRGNNRKLIDTLRTEIKNLNLGKTPFLENYIKYRLANLEQLGEYKNQQKFFSHFFKDQQVLLSNIEYMSVFNEFYGQYFINGGLKRKATEIRQLMISDKANVDRLRNIFNQDPLMGDGALGDLIVLRSLYSMFFDQNYSQHNVALCIKQLEENTSYNQIKEIAFNILKQVSKTQKYRPAPSFTLRTVKGEERTLMDYRGRFLILNFWKNDCPACENQMKYLNGILTDFPGRVAIASISASPHMGFDRSMQLKYRLPWDFMNFNNNYDLLDSYDVKFFPTFVLINPDGLIVKNPAPFPDGNLNELIKNQIIEWGKEKK